MVSCLLVRLSGSEITLLIYSFIVSLSHACSLTQGAPGALPAGFPGARHFSVGAQ